MNYARYAIWLTVYLYVFFALRASIDSYKGADHDYGDYTWEHSLDEWSRMTPKPHYHWTWVPLNYPGPPGLTHEEWGWYHQKDQ